MNTQNYNHPAYINIPFFILQDERLDFFHKLLFSFFWSFSLSGKRINASNGYLAALFKLSERHVRSGIEHLEKLGFIKRHTINFKRYIEVLYIPTEKIEIENTCDPLPDPSDASSSKKFTEGGTTVPGGGNHSSGGGGTTVPPYNKDNIKEDILKTPIVPKSKKISFTVSNMLENNPNGIDKALLEEWTGYRKKPITERVWKKTNEVMIELSANHNLDPVFAFERMLEKQWQGMEVSYFQDLTNKCPPRRQTAKPLDAFSEYLARKSTGGITIEQ